MPNPVNHASVRKTDDDDAGEPQLTLPDVLKVPPASRHGNVAEIIGKFGGTERLCVALNQLQSLLYAA